MKRWIHATEQEDKHNDHVKYFNEHYSKNVKNRIKESGKVYFLDPYQATKLIKSYNAAYPDAKLDIKPEISTKRDSKGREYAHFIVY